ncbi:MAG TPA: hypothetical protein VLA11_08530 [Woeseiaceae bacterium]|nr:hypothetical protein [Woeseiaceae bacterium]
MISLRFRTFLPVLLLLAGLPVWAQVQSEMRAFDAPTLRMQAKAEDLYRTGHWERAYFIYVNELAAIGDKYAQYMAGYMWLNGKGVPRDAVRASAWYRIAAERGSSEFIKVRDELLESMSQEQLLESDQHYVSLRQKYSDVVVALGLLRREREALNETSTGSRLAGNTSSTVTIINPRTGMTTTRGEFDRKLKAQMKIRLDAITRTIGMDELEPDMSDREFAELVARVDEYLQFIDDR